MTTDVFQRLDVALAGVPRRGVVHVGAHRGQEVPDYWRAGFDRIVLVEPNPALARFLESLPGVEVHACAAGAARRTVLNVTSWDERSSLLTPVDYPVVATVPVDVRPLADLQADCNVAVIDVQGAELDVLRSADLDGFDAVIVECCARPRYVGAAVTGDITDYMTAAGWRLDGVYGGHSAPDHVDAVWRNAR